MLLPGSFLVTLGCDLFHLNDTFHRLAGRLLMFGSYPLEFVLQRGNAVLEAGAYTRPLFGLT